MSGWFGRLVAAAHGVFADSRRKSIINAANGRAAAFLCTVSKQNSKVSTEIVEPIIPTNCCGSDCRNCVWIDYWDEVRCLFSETFCCCAPCTPL